MLKKAEKILFQYFGYKKFRTSQEEIVSSILDGRNLLGIIPTGSGKSICYQIPALLSPKLTIVISPLISLMKDQVDTLKISNIPSAFINSSLSKEEYVDIIRQLRQHKLKLLYIAPERLLNAKFINLLTSLQIGMVAVDEAHCISQWGHDFRKSYLEIPKFIEKLDQNIQITAFTATATPKVKEDIIDLLEMRNPKIFVGGFDRKNLFFKVVKNEDAESFLVDYLDTHRKAPGIIYASTRKEVDNLYAYLRLKHFSVGKYHAGLTDDERKKFQNKFITGDIRVMIATNAFGMGIDKSNVRFVIHRNIPKDIESYYQEAGRGGRDGGQAECILMFYPEDIGTQEFFIDMNKDLSPVLKRDKLKKLDKMVAYTEIKSCLREYTLKYFGDRRIKNYCGNCSNCTGLKDVENNTVDAQKVLSCIGRSRENVGVRMVIRLLLGETSDKITRKGLDKISTFGIFKDYDKNLLEEFINYLISEGYIDQTAGSYPVLKLNEKSFDVLSGNIKVLRKKNEVVSFDYYENPVFERLNEVRRKIAEKEGIAPYVLLSDVTLMELADKKPTNRWEMLKIKGIGNQKFENYGQGFLDVLITEAGIENLKNNGSQEAQKADKKYLVEIEKVKHLKESLNLDVDVEELAQAISEIFF
ncbi:MULTISPECIES: DNA helicase RecQ [Psychrilyobacter]|uniref:DNA helicase RecQ n=1 Tax=Psychrilyobacter piezotolerans TaxID=2293438 RepID=A0ABX9KJJ6_9FUSO|nr:MULTISPECIES: DNA helicase RecQ [Psychrilyobacter]MCS5421907.1 DNA helicase RecQ [Psychrilyobacter sp. S5]NDI77074.1 DNA helicase RecQ [Psychrilyobacter piezotolerans]RDE64690.1 DNA helicase RecQ [Psychrilyobacter sp. S5]REI42502.1 DNA helicase RecQ [Psychrilyobacter piezotolerans]